MSDVHSDGMEWVHDVDLTAWEGQELVTMPVEALIPTQRMVNVECLLSIERMHRDGIQRSEPFLAVMRDGQLYIRDGHHDWMHAVMTGQPSIKGLLAEVEQ
jgi:hypothetical protein